jgi:Dermatopontin
MAFSTQDFKNESKNNATLIKLMNQWHGSVNFVFENGEFAVTGMGSIYSDLLHDRRWWFYIAETMMTVDSNDNCEWRTMTHQANDEYDHDGGIVTLNLHLYVTADEWIAGAHSEYVQRDRRWRFYVCHHKTRE